MDIPIISHTIKPTVFISSQLRVFSEERETLQKLIYNKFGFAVYKRRSKIVPPGGAIMYHPLTV